MTDNNEALTEDFFAVDGNQDLFDTWIHPVLDLLQVPIDNLKASSGSWDNLRYYLRCALAARDARARHLAADEVRDALIVGPPRYDSPAGPARLAADLVHPVHGDEADCTDFHTETVEPRPLSLRDRNLVRAAVARGVEATRAYFGSEYGAEFGAEYLAEQILAPFVDKAEVNGGN